MSTSTLTAFTSQVAMGAKRHRLWRRGDHLLLALSGGPDSTALLTVLIDLAPRFELTLSAAHLNYGLRGADSAADAAFVEHLCAQWKIPLTVMPVTMSEWRTAGRSLQDAARRARYAMLTSIARERGATKIALGHTADDQAETVLLWMLRGAGTTGLGGMPRRRAPGIIRPLLDHTRREILDYLNTRGIQYRTDASNSSRRYTRNRIRLDVLPALRAINPSIVTTLGRQADILRADAACLDRLASAHARRLTRLRSSGESELDIAAFGKLPLALQRRVLRLLLQSSGNVMESAPLEMIDRLVALANHGRSGASLHAGRMIVTKEYERLVWRRAPFGHDRTIGAVLTIPGDVQWPPTGQWLTARTVGRTAARPDRSPSRIYLDAERLSAPLLVRSWRAGDRIQPSGVEGRKKLQDLFSDMKMPQALRHRVPIVVA